MKWARLTKAYHLVPTRLTKNIEALGKYALGKPIKNRIDLYQKYLSVSDERYLRWAIYEMLHWKQRRSHTEVIHIHGDRDKVFPLKYIRNCTVVPGGTHIMIINRFRWFNEHLPKIITSG